MLVKKLKIIGFRNLTNFFIQFADLKNLIFGVNGSGKTSIIEALFLLGFGKSFLPAKKQDMTNFNASGFNIYADIANKFGENTLLANYDKKLSFQLNNEKATLIEANQNLYPLFFSSQNYSFFIDHNPYFRKMIDRFIFGLHSLYLHHVLMYNNIVKQKNYLLKKIAKPINNLELESWNKLISEMGFEIVKKRMTFVDQLNNEIKRIFDSGLIVNYYPAVLSTPSITEATILADLQLIKNSEINCKRCLIGPQRDKFDVMIAGKKLQLFSSGEKKKYLIMIYMAFIELFNHAQKDYPVFLIDDYDAALDEKNLHFIIDHFPQIQIIATSVAKNEKFGHLFELKKEN